MAIFIGVFPVEAVTHYRCSDDNYDDPKYMVSDHRGKVGLGNNRQDGHLCPQPDQCHLDRYLDFAFDDLADGIALLGPTTLANADRHKHAIDEHETLLDAIRRRDAPGAERAAREHIRAALQARESGLETE